MFSDKCDLLFHASRLRCTGFMQMGAITDHYGLEAIRRALEVGVDARFGNNLQYDEEIVPRVIKIKQRPGEAGVISEQRIDQFWRRIMRLKNLTAAP